MKLQKKLNMVLAMAFLLCSSSCHVKASDKVSGPTADTLATEERAVVNDSPTVTVDKTAQEQDLKAFVEKFYADWEERDLLDYDYVKQHITPQMLEYLINSYDYECEGECLATWLFFYEGGGDCGGLTSRRVTVRDEQHVLVENKYENYEYDVLLTVVKVGDTYKIDDLEQKRSEYLNS